MPSKKPLSGVCLECGGPLDKYNVCDCKPSKKTLCNVPKPTKASKYNENRQGMKCCHEEGHDGKHCWE